METSRGQVIEKLAHSGFESALAAVFKSKILNFPHPRQFQAELPPRPGANPVARRAAGGQRGL
jgi:hypothetical protein